MSRLATLSIAMTLAASGLAAPLASPLAAQSPRAILGHWIGESICIKASWNAACHDEQIVYDFTPLGADSMRVHQVAYKIVAGRPELMGELDYTYDPTQRAWLGEFSNARVHVVWRYELHGAELVGRVNMLPSGKRARTVRAHRSAPAP